MSLALIARDNKHNYMTNIKTLLAKDNNMTTFVKGLQVAGLEDTLSQTGPFTVFAPTNLSFGKLERGVVHEWEEGKHTAELKTVLAHHIVPGTLNFAALTNGATIKTIDGQELLVEVNGKSVTINKAEVLGRDIEASNGFIHSIDRVIVNN